MPTTDRLPPSTSEDVAGPPGVEPDEASADVAKEHADTQAQGADITEPVTEAMVAGTIPEEAPLAAGTESVPQGSAPNSESKPTVETEKVTDGTTHNGHDRMAEAAETTTSSTDVGKEQPAGAGVFTPAPSGPAEVASSSGVKGPVGMRPTVLLRALTMDDMRKAKAQVSRLPKREEFCLFGRVAASRLHFCPDTA